ncbi:MAG TPA: phosphatidylglycerophosphatase A [Candidatus Nitrosopolaris sp.]|nr:phosphatidylglycerophosphatase A [Candidatus Nitrosopolaris sp.]
MRALALALATVGGVGYAPLAPGTVGSLAALPLLPALAGLRNRSLPVYAALLLGLVVAAVWAAGRAEIELGGHDDAHIVIDEVAGLIVAGIFLPGTWSAAGIAFLAFRVFDIVKPFPARTIDRRVRGGIGVVGDDLVAGVYAGLVTRLITRLIPGLT